MTVPLVIIDTTTTAKDVLLDSTEWEQILALVSRGHIRLVVPEVVVRETARHWEREVVEQSDLDKSIKRIRGRVDRLKRLGIPVDLEIPEPPHLGEVNRDEFADRLRKRLEAAGATVAALPDVPVEEILRRDLDSRRPFQGTGKGFRDALVWETVRELLDGLEDQRSMVYFVSDNTSDYYDGEHLHRDLSRELPTGVSVEMIRNLPSLLKEKVLAELVAALQVADPDLTDYLLISEDEPAQLDEFTGVTKFVTSALVSALEGLSGEEIETGNSASAGIGFADVGVSSYLENPYIAWVEPLDEVADWQAYETFDQTTLLIQASIGVEVGVEGSVHRSEYIVAEEEGVSISGFDLDEHYCDGTMTVTARARYQVRVEAGVGVEDIEFEGFEPA